MDHPVKDDGHTMLFAFAEPELLRPTIDPQSMKLISRESEGAPIELTSSLYGTYQRRAAEQGDPSLNQLFLYSLEVTFGKVFGTKPPDRWLMHVGGCESPAGQGHIFSRMKNGFAVYMSPYKITGAQLSDLTFRLMWNPAKPSRR
ncbi:MAG TPA: hypothetical protein VLI05_06960 [Candidatus Saccharimonadia bacterium]|nr:hypothetical protein [Candidatus Saccharimonadia bacterium]